jgi:hypothetical protein
VDDKCPLAIAFEGQQAGLKLSLEVRDRYSVGPGGSTVTLDATPSQIEVEVRYNQFHQVVITGRRLVQGSLIIARPTGRLLAE